MAKPTLYTALHRYTAAELQGQFTALPYGIIGSASRSTSSSTTTTSEIGVLRLDSIPVEANRIYTVDSGPLIVASTVAADVVRSFLRYDLSGAAATTASTQLALLQDSVGSTAFPPATVSTGTTFVPVVDGLVSVLISVQRVSGTGSVSIIGGTGDVIEFVIRDNGPAPGNTGVAL